MAFNLRTWVISAVRTTIFTHVRGRKRWGPVVGRSPGRIAVGDR